MGKKVYQPLKDGWGSEELKKRYTGVIVNNRNNPYSGAKKMIAPTILKKKAEERDLEEATFIEELKQEKAAEELLLQQEKQLSAINIFNKLNDTQKQVVSQIAKAKKLDLNSPKLFDDKEINKYVNDSVEYNNLRNKDKYLSAEKKYEQIANKETGFFNLKNWKAEIDLLSAKFHSSAQMGTVGNTKAEQERYKQVAESVRRAELPIVSEYLKSVEKQLKEIEDTRIGYNTEADANVRSQYGVGPGESAARAASLFMADNELRGKQTSALSLLQKKKRALQDYINGDSDVISGFTSMTPDLATAGLSSMVDELNVTRVKNKIQRGEELDIQDEQLLKAYNATQQVDGLNLDKDRFWYRTGKGTAQSAVFMEQALLTAPVGGVVGKGISQISTPLAEKLIGNTIARSLSFTEGKAAAKTLEFLATKGINVVDRAAIGTGELLSQALVMPNTYQQGAQKFIGQTQLVTDAEGNEKVLVTKSQRVAYEKEANSILSSLDLKEKEIKAKKNLSDSDKEELQRIDFERQRTKDSLSQIYDGKNIMEDVGAKDAFIYGYTESLKELAAERYVGGAIDKATGAGSTINRILSTNKFTAPVYNTVGKVIEPISKRLSEGNKVLNSMGRLSSNLAAHSGTSKLFNSLPGEMVEEIAVQLMPTYMGNYADQLEQLADPTFYLDVAAQTLLMGAGPTSIGTAKHLAKFATDKEYRDNYRKTRDLKEELKGIYKNIDKSITDDDLAKHIAMKSSNTLFDYHEYNAKINELKLAGKTEEAASLEKKSLRNIAFQALSTGTLDKFESTLKNMQYNDNLSDSTKQEAINFLPKLEELKKVEAEHRGKVNYGDILSRKLNSIIYRDTIAELDKRIETNKEDVDRFIQKRKDLGILPEDFNIGFGIAQQIDTNEEVNSTLAKLAEEYSPLQEMLNLQYTKDMYTEADLQNTMDLEYELNPKNQEEIKAKYDKIKTEGLVASATTQNLPDVKQEIVDNNLNKGEDGESVTSKADKAAYDKEIEEQKAIAVSQPTTQTDKEVDPDAYDGPTPDEVEYAKDFVSMMQNEIAKQNGTVENVEDNLEDGETPFNAPLTLDNSENSNNIVGIFEKGFKDGKGTFKGIVGAMLNEDPSFTDQYYDHIVEGFNRARPDSAMSKSEALRIYEEIFGNTQNIKNTIAQIKQSGLTPSNTATPANEVIEVNNVVSTVEEAESNTEKSTIVDMVTGKRVDNYKGYKTNTPDVKLAFIGQRIEVSEDGTGYVNATNEVTPEAHAAIHFENFKPGDKVRLEFNWDYFNQKENITVNIQNEDGTVDVKSKTIVQFVEDIFGKGYYSTFVAKMRTPEGRTELISNENFLGSMPTNTILENGTVTELGINSLDWWNTKNVALETNPDGDKLYERQKQVIKEAKERNLRLRQSMAQGNVVELTVESKTEGFHNKQLPDADGNPSTKFQSILGAFGNNTEAALNTIGLGAMKGDAPCSYIDSNGRVVVSVGGEQVLLDKSNSNIIEFTKAMKEGAGDANGKNFMIYQNGYNEQGQPQYIIRALITDHESMAGEYQRQYDLMSHIDRMGDILRGKVEASQSQKEKAVKIRDYFKKEFNVDILDFKQLNDKVKDFYPKLKDKASRTTSPNRFRQDYNFSNKENTVIPDITGVQSIAELEAQIINGSLPKTTSKELYMRNAHTQYIFSEITSENHPSVWTTEVQPKIKFSDEFVQQETTEERERDIQEKVATLKGNQEIKAELQEAISKVEDPLEKRQLQRELKKVEAETTQISNELVSEGVNVKEAVKEQPKQETKKPTNIKFGENEINTINQHIMYSALKNIKTKEFTEEDIYIEAAKQLDKLIASLEEQGKTKEFKFVKENRNKILGIGEGNYDGSVREMVQTLYDIQQGEAVEFTSEYVKDSNKESFENDIATSLSMRVKMLLSGVKDTRVDTSDNIAGLPEYFTFKDTIDFLQQALSETHNNSLEDLRKWIFDKVKKNPKEFNFYYDIYRRLRTLQKTDPAFLNEILYFLHQPQVNMTFMMYSLNDKGIYTVQKYDANAKNPQIAKKAKWNQNLKTSPLISMYEESFYRVNEDAYNRLEQLYNNITDARDNDKILNFDELSEYFSMFGIRLNHATLEALNRNAFDNNDFTLIHKEPGQSSKGLLASNQIFELLYKNIKTARDAQNTFGKTLSLNKDNVTENTQMYLNPLTSNTTSALKRLIDADNMMSAYNLNSMRIAGKSINPFQQSKSITNTISKLKNDKNFIKRLKDTPITANSFIVELLEKHPELAGHISSDTLSLEALKELGTDSRDDMGPTSLSDLDAMVTLFNLFAQDDGTVSQNYNGDDTIRLRKGSIVFPTLSDSSQQPILNTVLLDLKRSNFDDLEMNQLSDNIVAIIVDKLVTNELNRTAAFINSKASTNIKGHDAGAQFINSLASLNSILVDSEITVNGEQVTVRRPLIEVFKNHNNATNIPWIQDVPGFIEKYQQQIYSEVRENISNEVKQVLNTFENEEILVRNEDGSSYIKHIDNKYLDSKSDMTGEEKARLIATDYVVNNMISLNEIQNIFAGDTANYFKDKMVADLEFGLPKVTVKDLADYYYNDDPAVNAIADALVAGDYTKEDIETIKLQYPKLLSGTELALNDSLDQRVEDINPIARLKMVDMYRDVQNNLSKRLKELISPGNQYPNSMDTDQRYYQIMLQDVENSSEVLHSLAQRFHPEVYESVKNTIDKFKELDDIYESNRNEVQQKRHKQLKSELEKTLPEIKSFLKNATTDAQEYSTWQDNLNQLKNQGRVTQDEFDAIFDKLTAQADDIDKYGHITKENEWKPNEKDLRSKSVMQVSKPLYSGHHLETTNGYNHSRYIYIKSSSFPLTPELTVGFPKLNAMRKNMEKWQEVDPKTRRIVSTIRASYDSANKVGAVKKGLPITELYKDNPDLGLIGNNTVELEKANFFIQQDKPFKSDINAKKGKRDEITRATQFEKIILGDGINQIEEYVFPNLFDTNLLSELGVEPVEGNLNGPQLKQIYDGIYEREQKMLTEKYYRELGITDINDIANGKPEVMEKLVSKLKQRLSNKQDLKALELEYVTKVDGKNKILSKQQLDEARLSNSTVEVSRAQLKIPLYMMPNSNKFESVLNSMINKNNINLKLPGSSSPVASQEGFDYKGYSQEEFEKAKANGLITTKNFDPAKGLQATRTEDGKLKFAQVFVANKYKVYNKENGQYEYIDLKDYVDENNQIDTTKLPEELLSMFSFRIPTSSHQSGVIIEIAGFLPHTSADLMIVPKDHTTQIGEDYDIDMRYFYQYNYIKDANGNLKKLEYSDLEKPEGSYEDIRKEYEDSKKQLFDEFFKVSVDTNNPLGAKAQIKNPLWQANKETLLQIAFIDEALDHARIQDTGLDRIVHSLFDEDMVANSENLTFNELKRMKQELYENMIPKTDISERATQMREEYKSVIKDLRRAYSNEKSNFIQARRKYNNAIGQKANELKVIENNLVGMYKSVFSSNDDRVQKLINKTLSTDSADNTATEMDKVLNSAKASPYYSFHSPTVQREITKLGSSGKIGIGEHSNAVTMNSIFQQTNKENRQIFRGYDREGEIIPYNLVLGDFTFNGLMGKVEVNGVRISEMAMEDQNSATDNQKLQIMGRRNEDKNTMGVLKILHSSGFDNDLLQINTTSGKQQLSYASLFINQPIIREYSRIVNNLSSASNPRKGNAKKQAIQELKNRLENKLPDSVWRLDKEGKPIIGTLDKTVWNNIGKTMTSQGLYNQLVEGDDLFQYVVLTNFNQLQDASTTYNELQRLVNIESDGMGISYFDTIENMETLLGVVNGEINITDSNTMIGDFEIGDRGEDLSGQGYVPVITKSNSVVLKSNLYNQIEEGQTIWVKPNNHFSHKIVNSVALGYNTYNSLFPYNSENINTAITEIMSNLNISENSEEGKSQKYKIVSDLKDYIYTNNQSLFGDVDLARKELFFEDENSQSLASYLLTLSQNQDFADLFRKPFFRDLSYKINSNTHPSTIEFNNSDISKINTLAIYNNFENMMRRNKKLPSFNGRDYSYKALMKDLLKYSLLADQGRGAIGFRQHLPIELFDKYGVTKGISNTTNISGNFQAIAYHGTTKSLMNALGGTMDENGDIDITNKTLTPAKIKGLVNTANKVYKSSFDVDQAFTYDAANDKVIFNYHDGSNVKSTFVKQYIQHNPKLVASISGKKLSNMLSANKYTEADINNGNVKEFYFDTKLDFVTIKNEAGKIMLFEKVGENFFKQIPTLGVFGLKEYNIRKEQKESSIGKNNVPLTPKLILPVDKSVIPSMLTQVDSENKTVPANLEAVLSMMSSTNSQGQFKPLFDLFREYVKFENVTIETGPPGNNYKAQYYPSGKIVLNPSLLSGDTFDMEAVSKAIAEEMMHHVTVNLVGRYINFTGINPDTGIVSYEAVKGEDGIPVAIPAEIHSLVNVYNYAIKQIIKKHGIDAVLDKVSGSNAHLNAETGGGNDTYRVSNIHEFIAGIFLKDEQFAQEMANTKYRSTGESIASKFFGLLQRLFHRVIPSMKKETVSGEVATSLFSLLDTLVNPGKAKKVIPKNLKNLYDTDEKRAKFAQSLRLIEKANIQMNRESLLDDTDNLMDFEDNNSLNSPVNFETFGEQAIKCK